MTLGRGSAFPPPHPAGGIPGGTPRRQLLSRIASILNYERAHIMKMKDLRKKIRRLERRLREGPQKLASLKRMLEAAEAANALDAARKSAARTAAVLIAEGRKRAAKRAKRKLNLSPERRAQLSAAMKARWAAKRAAEANAVNPSPQARRPFGGL